MKVISFLAGLLFLSVTAFAAPRPPMRHNHPYHHYHGHRNYRYNHYRTYQRHYSHWHYHHHYHGRPVHHSPHTRSHRTV
jgi:hypothetical protein